MEIKILLVDDSPFIRDFMRDVLSEYKDMKIIGEAENGKVACKKVEELKPDVILMDVHMPEMTGIEASEWIMMNSPTPIIIVTSDDTKETAIQAIEVGAIDVVLKPTINDIENVSAIESFVANIRNSAKSKALRFKKDISERKIEIPALVSEKPKLYDIIAIASSTGGPKVLHEMLPCIEHIPIPIVITQHLNKDFADQFITWFNKGTKRDVRFASDGEIPDHGSILFAPPDIHMGIGKSQEIIYIDEPKLNFQKPSADYMFSTIAETYAKRSMAIILTGMGRDGARGMLDIKKSGGYTIAQDEESCVVFGMPREAIKLDAINDILPYTEIPSKVKQIVV